MVAVVEAAVLSFLLVLADVARKNAGVMMKTNLVILDFDDDHHRGGGEALMLLLCC